MHFKSDSTPQPVKWNIFERTAEYSVEFRNLPHWDQSSALCFLTFRQGDSLPASVIQLWQAEQDDWIARNSDRRYSIEEMQHRKDVPFVLRSRFMKYRNQRFHFRLDECHGSCELSKPELARIVVDSLLKFDGERYDVERFVIMPNHVHVLLQMREGHSLRRQCTGWLRYTSRRINERLGSRGAFWQAEPFDHLVRSDREFEYLQAYINDNPKKANLNEDAYLLWERECSSAT